MKGIALLGAPQALWPKDLKQKLSKANTQENLLIGVDRGSLLLTELGFVPNLAVGDFDSLKKSELNRIEAAVSDIRYSVPEKDLTDTELAVRYAFEDYQVDDLILIGSTGGRLDHFLSNLFLVLKPEFQSYAENITIWDRQNLINFYLPGKHTVTKAPGYDYLGVVNLTAIQNLQIKKAKYQLENYSNSFPMSFSSNEFLPEHDSFELSFEKGVVAVIQSCDLDRYQNL